MTYQQLYEKIAFHIKNITEPTSQDALQTIARCDPSCFESVLKAILHSRNFFTEDRVVLASIEQVLIQLSEVRDTFVLRGNANVKHLSILVAAFANPRLEKGDFDSVPQSVLDRRSNSVANVIRAVLADQRQAYAFLDILTYNMCTPNFDHTKLYPFAYPPFLDQTRHSLAAMWKLFSLMEQRRIEPSRFESFFENLAEVDSYLFARNLADIHYSKTASESIRAAVVDVLSELAKKAELTQSILRSLGRCSNGELLNEVLDRSGSTPSVSFRPSRGKQSFLGSRKPVPPQHNHARDRRLVRQGLRQSI